MLRARWWAAQTSSGHSPRGSRQRIEPASSAVPKCPSQLRHYDNVPGALTGSSQATGTTVQNAVNGPARVLDHSPITLGVAAGRRQHPHGAGRRHAERARRTSVPAFDDRARSRNKADIFAQVRKDSFALRDGLPVRPRAQLAGREGCRGIRLITRSGRYRLPRPPVTGPSAAEQRVSGIRSSVPPILPACPSDSTTSSLTLTIYPLRPGSGRRHWAGRSWPILRETSSASCARRKRSSDEAQRQEPQTDPVRGQMRLVRE
jgi:hypothetical protein